MIRNSETSVAELESYLDAFESAHAADLEPSIEDFLPDVAHPRYAEIVGELLRIDVELNWQRSGRALIDGYRRRFADVLADPSRLAGLAFEEYRARCQTGEAPTPAEYRDRYGIDTADWPPPSAADSDCGASRHDLHHRGAATTTNGHAAHAADDAASAGVAFPPVGEKFLEFTLVEELGRGSFGRVYLARQSGLANRPVALKLSARASVEPERLAQLQHANIVPIYSFHQADGLYAVCMPFLGRFTLNDSLGKLRRQPNAPQTGMELLSTVRAHDDSTFDAGDRQDPLPAPPLQTAAEVQAAIVPSIRDQFERSNYVDAVVWVAAQIAAGLVHAHERGILHRDLKPANILLADDGRPMIVDFNLSDRVRLAEERAATVGGTLPYMAPEQLRALDTGAGIDARSDVYSLGVVLFELLARRLPFEPSSTSKDHSTAALIAERQRGAPSVRTYNPWIPRSIDALVGRCLAPNPEQRYQSAGELRTDLERHLANEPLKHAPDRSVFERLAKWVRRHPRLSSASSLGAAAAVAFAVIAGAWFVRERRFARVEAETIYRKFVDAAPSIVAPLSIPGLELDAVDEGIRAAQSQLGRYGVMIAADWRHHTAFASLAPSERADLDERFVTTLHLLASAYQRRASAAVNDTDRQAALQQALKYNAEAAALADQHVPELLEVVRRQRDDLHAALAGEARPEHSDQDLQSSTSDAELQALELIANGRYGDALPRLMEWRDRSPGDVSAWLLLGNAYVGMADAVEAEACYTVGVAQRPGFSFSYFLRGLARYEQHKFQGAADDFSKVLELGGCPTAALINRALARIGLGSQEEALADLDAALLREEAPTRAYFIRSQVRRSMGDHAGAHEDSEQGLRATPRDATSWLARGMARLASDPEGALADFQRALVLQPGSRTALQNIVHVLADRLHRERDALEYLDELVNANPQDARALASRAVARARLGESAGAVTDAKAALSASQEPKIILQSACAFALCSGDNAELASAAMKLVAKGLGADPMLASKIATDPDLASIRNQESFTNILEAAQVLVREGTSGSAAGVGAK